MAVFNMTAPTVPVTFMSQPTTFFPPPKTIADTGLPTSFIHELALKIIYFAGEIQANVVAEEMRLPHTNIVESALNFLVKEEFCQITGATGYSERAYKYVVTGKGSSKAQELLARNQYAGPAPVPLAVYNEAMERQGIGLVSVSRDTIRDSFNDIVISDAMLRRVGPAVNSARSIFLYGPPGNGKTTIAERMARLLGGNVYLPYAIYADGQIIRLYDQHNHKAVTEPPRNGANNESTRRDTRWVLCQRPFITVGGELTLETLDLIFDPVSKTYEAPFQMKANGGMFLIDDFGRQQLRPQDLLNRWILPLEKRYDFLTLITGKKIEIPFDVLIVFSTNLDPRDLMDEAFLRRIRYKINVPNPTWDDFRTIFQLNCTQRHIPYDEEMFKYLVLEHYVKVKREPKAVHPRDLLDQLMDIARYLQTEPRLEKELLDAAVDAYFVKVG
ncbi:MAG: ATP-binding protein [Chloroflexota bacterium]|nr:MAG: ATP-binding protein [Chloroflexota bacterium]